MWAGLEGTVRCYISYEWDKPLPPFTHGPKHTIKQLLTQFSPNFSFPSTAVPHRYQYFKNTSSIICPSFPLECPVISVLFLLGFDLRTSRNQSAPLSARLCGPLSYTTQKRQSSQSVETQQHTSTQLRPGAVQSPRHSHLCTQR